MYGLLALGGLFLILLAGFLLLRARKRHTRSGPPINPALRLPPRAQLHQLQQTGRFWGVRVEAHCRASSRIAGKQYTFDAPPAVPVDGCTEAQCICRLVGLPEQRRGMDRRSGRDRRQSLRMETTERRSHQPRRGGDIDSWDTYSHL